MEQMQEVKSSSAETITPGKSVYFFAAGLAEGNAKMKDILGGKGANLAEMTSLGLPVPPGFTISTEMCQAFYDNGEKLPDTLKDKVLEALAKVEKLLGKKFGDSGNPLLVSVRSGARASMPGMMDTILNLGLNDQTVEGLAKQASNARFAWDSYRRFVTMYSNVVMGMNTSLLEVLLEDVKEAKHYKLDTELKAEDLKALTAKYKKQILETTGKQFPNDPMEQLWGAISAVFRSWNSPRAVTYRQLNGYPSHWGTAVNVQSMVFGNMGEDCATGVAFTRNPSTGEKKFFGEFLINAQGEDVVAGIRTPHPISKSDASGANGAGASGEKSLEEAMPKAYADLVDVYQKLERHYRDMQDIEFTIEKNKLWMLQTRNGKRTAKAALRIACEMIDEKLISEDEALLRVQPQSLDQLLHPTLDDKAEKTLLCKGLPASPGGATGQIVFSSEDAVEWAAAGKKTLLVRIETSPEDIEGMV
jgi:pyruvate,orthophosphate dikinase